LLAKALSKPK
jgi:hypothetical protein